MRWVLRPRITTVELWAPTLPPVPINRGMKAASTTNLCSTTDWEAITAEVPLLAISSTSSHTTRRRAAVNRSLWK